MEQYTIFFDIDGTIVPEDTGIIPESAKKAISMAKENGHYTIINTGRTYAAIDECVKNLGFDGYICGCGTNIYFNGKELMKKQLGNVMSAQIVKALKKYHIDGILEGANHVYYRREPIHKTIKTIKNIREERGFDNSCDEFWDAEDICFDKMALWTVEGSDFDSFRNHYEEVFEFIHRDVGFYELVPTGYSKAEGMAFMEKELQMNHANMIAIGDSTNDLSMLEYANIGIAMGNSCKMVKNIADYITTDIHHNGIYQALEHFNLIG